MIKSVKQYCLNPSPETISEIQLLCHRYSKLRNFFFQTYGGYEGLKYIDDPWKMAISLRKQEIGFKLPGRIWKLCLFEVFTNIKVNWSNAKNDIKKAISNNENLSDEDKHYLRYILKSNILLYSIITRTHFDLPKKFKNYTLDLKYLHNLLNRYVRKYKFNKPIVKNAEYYPVNYFSRKGNILKIQGSIPYKLIQLHLTDPHKFKSQKIIKLLPNNTIEIISTYDIKEKENTNSEVIGIDKGLKTLISTSTNNKYGENFSQLSNDWQDKLNAKNKKRNKLRSISKNTGDIVKANNIKKFNLGTQKRNKVKNQQQSQLKSEVNHSINQFIKTEKPKEIILEDLSWSKFSNKGKRNNRNLSSWMKGYLQDRLQYKSNIFNIKVTEVNPAYTSQMCNKCGLLGKRTNDTFQCSTCGSSDADLNAAKNILNRRDDKEITKFTSVKKVMEILLRRLETVAGLSGATKTSETDSYETGGDPGSLSLEERNVLKFI